MIKPAPKKAKWFSKVLQTYHDIECDSCMEIIYEGEDFYFTYEGEDSRKEHSIKVCDDCKNRLTYAK